MLEDTPLSLYKNALIGFGITLREREKDTIDVCETEQQFIKE
jgi:hypothetical protein